MLHRPITSLLLLGLVSTSSSGCNDDPGPQADDTTSDGATAGSTSSPPGTDSTHEDTDGTTAVSTSSMDGEESSAVDGTSSTGGGTSSTDDDASSTSGGVLPPEGCSATDPAGIASGLAFVPERVLGGNDDVLYSFDAGTATISRWSEAAGVIAPAIALDPGALDVAYSSALHTLYIEYADGDITRIELDLGTAQDPFVTLAGAPYGLQAVGDYLLAVDDTGAWDTHHVFDADGMLVASVDWNRRSPEYTWSDVNERVYFFRQGTSPNDLHFEHVDQATGLIVAEGESPYHGAYDIVPPIRVSPDGAHVLLGSGHVYDAMTLERPAAIPVTPVDALGTGSGFVTLTESSGGSTLVERWEPPSWGRQDARLLEGAPVAITELPSGIVVTTLVAGELVLHPYEVGVDGDGDGVPFDADALPLDPAASIDSDHDGAPDEWNGRCADVDSITGLELDAHPDLAACSAAGVCDLAAQTVSTPPIHTVVDAAGVIYMLAPDDAVVLRWSSQLDALQDPLVVAPEPLFMTLHEPTGTLLVGHASGWIGRIDTAAEGPEEHFATLPESPHGLAMAGDYVLTADATGAWNTHSTFDLATGQEISREDWNRESSHYAWNASLQRIYFFRDGSSPNDLHFEVVDQATGEITADGESPHHGTYVIAGPIAVSSDGLTVLIGTGQRYDAVTLAHQSFLPVGSLVDARWDGNELLTLRNQAGSAVAERWSAADVLLASDTFAGAPHRVFVTPFGARVVAILGGQPVVHTW